MSHHSLYSRAVVFTLVLSLTGFVHTGTSLAQDISGGASSVNDITGGANTLRQVLARPVLRMNPYATPVKGLYLCSSSTPPGGGVHGMCGYFAARSARRRLARLVVPPPRARHADFN